MKRIAVIEKVAKIIEMVANSDGNCTLSDISRALNINPSTTCNLLQNLIQLGYLEKNEKSRKYKLGGRLIDLLSPVSKRKDIINASESVIKELAEKVRESVVLAIFHNNERYVVATAEYKGHLLNINLELFQKSGCYETATGRVLLAYLPKKELKQYIKDHGYPDEKWNNIRNFAGLIKNIKQIQNNQISIKKTKDVAAIAVPVFGPKGEMWASLGVYLPTTRFSNSKKIQICNELRKAAKQISENLAMGAKFEKTD